MQNVETENVATVETVKAEVMRAYHDCHNEDFERSLGIRNLDFRASAEVSPSEAVAIMRAAVPRGYNNFEAELLGQFPDDSKITLAREGSVCVYVKAPKGARMPSPVNLIADEYDVTERGELMVWWD